MLVGARADAGSDVFEAPDGGAALEVLSGQENVDLLVTDIQMPGRADRNVVEAYAKTRTLGLPVIYASGRPDRLKDPFA